VNERGLSNFNRLGDVQHWDVKDGRRWVSKENPRKIKMSSNRFWRGWRDWIRKEVRGRRGTRTPFDVPVYHALSCVRNAKSWTGIRNKGQKWKRGYRPNSSGSSGSATARPAAHFDRIPVICSRLSSYASMSSRSADTTLCTTSDTFSGRPEPPGHRSINEYRFSANVFARRCESLRLEPIRNWPYTLVRFPLFFERTV